MLHKNSQECEVKFDDICYWNFSQINFIDNYSVKCISCYHISSRSTQPDFWFSKKKLNAWAVFWPLSTNGTRAFKRAYHENSKYGRQIFLVLKLIELRPFWNKANFDENIASTLKEVSRVRGLVDSIFHQKTVALTLSWETSIFPVNTSRMGWRVCDFEHGFYYTVS